MRIVGALIVAGALMTLAYALSGPSIFSSRTAGAESTEDLLRAFSSKDTDADGLPDWQEALYGTDPDNASSVQPGMTDGEAVRQGLVEPKFRTDLSGLGGDISVPGVIAGEGTVTDEFAKKLFTNYMGARSGTPPSIEEVNTFMQDALKELADSQRSVKAYSIGNLRVSGSGPDALRTYAAAGERAFAAHSITGAESELVYFIDAMQTGNTAAMDKVRALGRAYKNTAASLIQVHVPHEAQSAHLNTANALSYMSIVVENMTMINSDPLRGMLGISEYRSAAEEMVRAYAEFNAVFTSAGIVIPEGQIGHQFIDAAKNAAAAVPNI